MDAEEKKAVEELMPHNPPGGWADYNLKHEKSTRGHNQNSRCHRYCIKCSQDLSKSKRDLH